jgi:acetyl-CoA synthetase
MIKARVKAENPEANLKGYDQARRVFSWEEAERAFSWHKTGKINIVHEAIDRWVEIPRKRDQKALVFDKGAEVSAFSYLQMKEISGQWAHLLREHSVNLGDRLFNFLPPCPETYFALLGAARLGAIFCPLYSTLGYDELEGYIDNARPRAIVTHPDLAERLPLDAMQSVEHVFYTHGPLPGLFKREILVPDLLNRMDRQVEPTWLGKDTPLFLIFTSGSTGPPKGVVHAHGDMVGHFVTARDVLDVREDTVVWTDGDPAWITGTVYGSFGPWLCGATSLVQGNPFSASTWYRLLERHRVAVWYTSPMTLKKLVQAGEDLPTRYNLSNLQHIASVGETLLPELFYWVKKNLKRSPHDTWWMSETGMICLANFSAMDIKPGSMGKPVPGIDAAVVDENGVPLPLLTMGELALKIPWPSLMAGIWRDEGRYEAYFRFKGWFLTGDMALQDEEGYFYHQGRMDDLMKVGEKVIGPYDIEQVLCRHPAVREAAVISKGMGESQPHLKAFVTIAAGYTPSSRLNQEVKAFLKANLSAEVPLREIAFLEKLPKTSAGKLLRRVLRARELGLPGGDATKMED